MTTDDNRSRAAGGYSDSGLFDSDDKFRSSRSDPSAYDDEGYSSAQTTTVIPGTPYGEYEAGVDDDDLEPSRPPVAWHGGLDFGLLVLRLVLGGLFVVHGLDKLFGWFDGVGRSGTEDLLSGFGFSEPKILTWVLAVSETAGGALLILGLLTPVGAAAILGVMANVIIVKGEWSQFLGGVEVEMMYAGAAFALLFTGPGRIAIDRNTHWFRKAPAYGFVFLIIAAGATAVTLLVFR